MAFACNCVGPQAGQPLCPCMMAGVAEKDGRWVKPEQDLGPVQVTREIDQALRRALLDGHKLVEMIPQGCVCPVGAEATCKGALCPRRGIGSTQ